MRACLCACTFVKQPNPQGSLSRRIPSSCIESANKQVSAELAASIRSTTTKRKRGPYNRYMPKEKAEIAKYAVQHGMSAALRHFKDRFPELKLSVVNDWKEAMLKASSGMHHIYSSCTSYTHVYLATRGCRCSLGTRPMTERNLRPFFKKRDRMTFFLGR